MLWMCDVVHVFCCRYLVVDIYFYVVDIYSYVLDVYSYVVDVYCCGYFFVVYF